MQDNELPQEQNSTTGQAWLSIGALAKASGVPVETLRTWERRYDYPQPTRLPSGHRRYPANAIAILVRVRTLLAEGHRASDLLHDAARGVPVLLQAVEPELRLVTAPAVAPSPVTHGSVVDALRERVGFTEASSLLASGLAEVLDGAFHLDATRVDRALAWQWQRRGGIGFLAEFCGPLLETIGQLWRAGVFDVHHEHFASERLRDFLGSRTLALTAGTDVCVVAATMAGERHVLGLHMATAALAMAGVGAVFLGADLPARVVATAATQVDAKALILSVSQASRPEQVEPQLFELRAALDPHRALVVGGRGAFGLAPIAGVEVLHSLPDLMQWAESLRPANRERA